MLFGGGARPQSCLRNASALPGICERVNMPLFAIPTGAPCAAAENAAHDLQTWLDFLSMDEYGILSEELEQVSDAERPMVSRCNAVIDRLKAVHGDGEADPNWGLMVKNRL